MTHTTSYMECPNSGNVLDFVRSLKRIVFRTQVPWKYSMTEINRLFYQKMHKYWWLTHLHLFCFCFQWVKKLTDFQHLLLFRNEKKNTFPYKQKKKTVRIDVICGISLVFETTRTFASIRITNLSISSNDFIWIGWNSANVSIDLETFFSRNSIPIKSIRQPNVDECVSHKSPWKWCHDCSIIHRKIEAFVRGMHVRQRDLHGIHLNPWDLSD